jgi:hypothetical protein
MPTDEGHLPDFYTCDGLKDLIIFACGIELQNAICPLSYQPTDDDHLVSMLANCGLSSEDALQRFDVSSSTYEMRVQNVHSRGRAITLLKVIFSRIGVVDTEGGPLNPWLHLFIPTLAWFLHSMMAYANIVQPSYLQLFFRQLEWTAKQWPELHAAVDRLQGEDSDPQTLLWPDYPQVTISRSATIRDVVHDDAGVQLPFIY